MADDNEIKLELGLGLEPETPVAAPEVLKEEKYLENVNLSDAELKMVDDFATQIDLSNTAIVLQYGASAQKKIADFSENALDGVRTKDLGEISGLITDLVSDLKGFDVTEEQKGLFGFLKKGSNSMTKIKAKYDTVEKNVDKVTDVLEGHRQTLTKDIVMLDNMYESNLTYYKELTMYIIAGKKKLAQERETTLKDLEAKAKESGLAEDAQAANDFAAQCDRFEKKLYDLELTRTISMQMAPQIRMIQNNDSLMVEKIQSTIVNTIPLWKNQMVLALGMHHSQEAMKAQSEVNDLTNELLRKNADALRTGSTEIAKESERSIIDIETIQHTNEQLIATLDDVLQIQEEGRQKRREAESELYRIEEELKAKLLEIRG